MKKPYFVARIGGIPTVLHRDGETNMQIAQHQTMRDAKEEAARRNLNAEFAPKFAQR
jgi:hypothetical protein